MQPQLAGRHALVSGGSRGIGRAVATALTAAGASVTVLGRGEAVRVGMISAQCPKCGHVTEYEVVAPDATDLGGERAA